MSVKTIFKTLIGTIMLLVMSSVIIELFNVNITGMQIRQMTNMSAKQACTLFTQETYKTNGSEGATKMANVLANDGSIYISGNYYSGKTNMYDIWESIYTTSAFSDFCNGRSTSGHKVSRLPSGYSTLYKAYPDLEILQIAVNSGGNVAIPATPSWNASETSTAVKNYNKANKAQAYYDSMFTTANLGIPYLDDEIVNKMFRWNLAQILSNCDSDSIQKDANGNYFINYKGFRCYAQAAEIYEYDYRTYNLKSSTDRVAFNNDTGMNANQLGRGSDRVDNNFVTVVGIKYRIPISYAGITPIKNIFNYVWNNEVAGLDGTYSGMSGSWANEKLSTVTNNVRDGIEYLQAGGVKGNNSAGLMPSVGELTYVLVR